MRVGSWNTELRLTQLAEKGRGTPGHILKGIETIDADVLVLPEAFQEVPADGVDEALSDMGYVWRDAAYLDRGREQLYADSMPHMRILSRLAIVHSEQVRFGDVRTTLFATVVDPESGEFVDVYGVHLTEQTKALRVEQGQAMVRHVVHRNLDRPTIATGDWNATHGGSRRERLLGGRAVRFMAGYLPNETARYYAKSMTDMMEGDELAGFEQVTGMRDLDPLHRPTTTPKIRGALEVLPSVPIMQIDHMYANDAIKAGPVEIGPDHGSDHRWIVANVAVKRER